MHYCLKNKITYQKKNIKGAAQENFWGDELFYILIVLITQLYACQNSYNYISEWILLYENFKIYPKKLREKIVIS